MKIFYIRWKTKGTVFLPSFMIAFDNFFQLAIRLSVFIEKEFLMLGSIAIVS